jgi:hypothetical protein
MNDSLSRAHQGGKTNGPHMAGRLHLWRPLGDSNPCYNRERVVS